MTNTVYYGINGCKEPCIVYMDMMGSVDKVSIKDGLRAHNYGFIFPMNSTA